LSAIRSVLCKFWSECVNDKCSLSTLLDYFARIKQRLGVSMSF
jgi:hypothetical protein